MLGKSTSAEAPRGVKVSFADDLLTVELRDGRVISTPLLWYPRLDAASDRERATWEWIGSGTGIHWPELDEDLSIAGMLAGRPSVEFDQRVVHA